jgi:hypothetical protein
MIYTLMATASLVSLVILSPRLRMRGTIRDFGEARFGTSERHDSGL